MIMVEKNCSKSSPPELLAREDFQDESLLKLSCESCITSKVKCSKHKPVCARCSKTGRNCMYLPKKRNMRKKRKPVSKIEKPPASYLGRSKVGFGWWVLEDLALKFGNGAGLLMYDLRRHLRAAQLQYRKSNHYSVDSLNLKRIESILASKEINLDDYFDYKHTVLRKVQEENNHVDALICEFSLYDLNSISTISKKFAGTSKYFVEDFRQQVFSTTPCIRCSISTENFLEYQGHRFDLEINEAFSRIFGKSTESLLKELEEVNRYLPYGASVLSLIADETDLLKFLELQCMKAKQLRFPSTVPWYWEIPSMTSMPLNVMKYAFENSVEKVDFLVTSYIRYLNQQNSLVQEIFMTFKPMEDLSHLLDCSDKSTDSIDDLLSLDLDMADFPVLY